MEKMNHMTKSNIEMKPQLGTVSRIDSNMI